MGVGDRVSADRHQRRSEVTETQLIARQAKQIEELRDEVADLKDRAKKALSHIYCIGGPLNDNKLKYTGEQLRTFANIADELSE